jgi:hypothetical protein
MTIRQQIKSKIESMPEGNVFTLSDLADVADYKNIKLNVSRLKKDGLIRRVIRGVYDYPEYSEFIGEYVATGPDDVANALARNYAWTIVPCGDQCLNMLGLSTQVVAVYAYLSDGPSRTYKVRGMTLTFEHRASKDITNLSFKTALVVQAIIAWGKNDRFDRVIRQLARRFGDEDKQIMLKEARYVTDWVYEIIKKVCTIKLKD